LLETLGRSFNMTRYEKRQVVRKRTDQLLYLELGADNGGIILNLSDEGCNFQAIGPVMEKELQFEFALGAGQQIQGKGQITWLDQTRKLGGLRFNGLAPEHRQQICKWLAEAKAIDDTGDLSGEGFALAAAAAPVDSLAKLRRRQLREEARLQWEAAQNEKDNVASAEHTLNSSDAISSPREIVKAPATTLQGVVEEVFAHEEKKRAVFQTSRLPAQLPPEKLRALGSEILGLRDAEQDPRPGNLYVTPVASPNPELHLPDIQKPRGVWRGVVAIFAGAALAGGALIYHREIGHSLIWLGATITGESLGQEKTIQNDSRERPAKIGTPEIPARQASGSPSDSRGEAASVIPAASQPDGGTVARGNASGRATGQNDLGSQTGSTPRNTKNVASSPAEDVQALWALVESGDTHAEVKLAEHYAKGDGVIKSCGQAKVLLMAAARKGDVDAKRKLDDLERLGCP
jgi:hypothetical protein